MTEKLIETLKLIIKRYVGRIKGRVFIPKRVFSWYNVIDGQLSELHEAGMITKPV